MSTRQDVSTMRVFLFSHLQSQLFCVCASALVLVFVNVQHGTSIMALYVEEDIAWFAVSPFTRCLFLSDKCGGDPVCRGALRPFCYDSGHHQ